MNSGRMPSPTSDTCFISNERMRFALMNSWSVSDDGLSIRHEAP